MPHRAPASDETVVAFTIIIAGLAVIVIVALAVFVSQTVRLLG